MLLASTITRSLRSSTSRDFGPGSSVTSSIVFPMRLPFRDRRQQAANRFTIAADYHPLPMVLSDHTIREEIAAGRIVVDPFDDALVQPCSIDVRVGEKFRVFRNSRYPYIDVKQPMEDLTELVTV